MTFVKQAVSILLCIFICLALGKLKLHMQLSLITSDLTSFLYRFPPSLWYHLAEMWNKSLSKYLICYLNLLKITCYYNFDVDLITQTSTTMHGSSKGHMCYFYSCGKRLDLLHPNPECDPMYADAQNLINRGLMPLKNAVDKKLKTVLNSGRPSRS